LSLNAQRSFRLNEDGEDAAECFWEPVVEATGKRKIFSFWDAYLALDTGVGDSLLYLTINLSLKRF
jgi:hypothetical protein